MSLTRQLRLSDGNLSDYFTAPSGGMRHPLIRGFSWKKREALVPERNTTEAIEEVFVEKKVKDVISSYVDLIMKLIYNCVNRRGQKEQEGDA